MQGRGRGVMRGFLLLLRLFHVTVIKFILSNDGIHVNDCRSQLKGSQVTSETIRKQLEKRERERGGETKERNNIFNTNNFPFIFSLSLPLSLSLSLSLPLSLSPSLSLPPSLSLSLPPSLFLLSSNSSYLVLTLSFTDRTRGFLVISMQVNLIWLESQLFIDREVSH